MAIRCRRHRQPPTRPIGHARAKAGFSKKAPVTRRMGDREVVIFSATTTIIAPWAQRSPDLRVLRAFVVCFRTTRSRADCLGPLARTISPG
jgi:hypothetical protein